MSLTAKQQLAMNKIIEGKSVFISGPGGVGKSYLIDIIKDKFDGAVVLAPTGIAALNIVGATIHSAFKLPHTLLTKQHHTKINKKAEELFDKNGPVKKLVIDEISMVRGDVMETIDQQLRRIRRLNVPFGGLQLIIVGDFFQLPPVVTNRDKQYYFKEYDSAFAFGGNAWSNANLDYIELDEIVRQTDETFIENLQTIRQKKPGYQESVKFFNRIGLDNTQHMEDQDPVFLCTINRNADYINKENYDSLDGAEKTYTAKISGQFKAEPSPKELSLKVGTKVMFTANTDSFKNGEIGYVAELFNDGVFVIKEQCESEVFVETHTWEEREYTTKDGNLQTYPVGSYKQLPIKYAWAVTIHKSQGLTLPSAVIDLGSRGAFASGQLYVALSRIKTLNGLGLISPIQSGDVIVDKEIQDFYANGCKGIGLDFA